MERIIPPKIKSGDTVRIIAPSRSFLTIDERTRAIADKRLRDLGLLLTFGKNVNEEDDFHSSGVTSRLEDLHEAFSDKKVRVILTAIGGFNSNQLLKEIDWGLIKKNPKIFCGLSDITALNNAFFVKTGLVNYSGPHYFTFGQKLHFDYTLEYFKKCLMSELSFEINPSKKWSDDKWYKNQEKRNLINNNGFMILNEGQAEGLILGGNLCTFNLLQGTEYFPSLEKAILFIEDDHKSLPHIFDRDLHSLIHQTGFGGLNGLIIGRFQKESNMREVLLRKIIKAKKELNHIPIVANADFGHTEPKITFPIGGTARLLAKAENIKLEIIRH